VVCGNADACHAKHAYTLPGRCITSWPDFDALLRRIARQTSLSTEAILSPGKARPRVRARSLLCYLAARCLGMTMTELSRRLGVTVAAVSIAVGRAEQSVQTGEIDLEKILKLNI
jgi:chromosomal replication initiation ATPase DnaA